MKQDNNIAIEVLEAEITACEISRARKIVINENRKAAEMDKEITSLQHSIQTLSSTDKVKECKLCKAQRKVYEFNFDKKLSQMKDLEIQKDYWKDKAEGYAQELPEDFDNV